MVSFFFSLFIQNLNYSEIAFIGQKSAQAPQFMHLFSSITGKPCPFWLIASTGQTLIAGHA